MALHQASGGAFNDVDRAYNGPSIRGGNPALLVDKPVRERIFDSYYWREQCFGLNTATLLDRAVALTSVGGTYGGGKASPFLCLLFKLLQLAPEKKIVIALLQDETWKYLRALAAMYVRLTYSPADIYRTLEPYLSDYRKLRRRTKSGWAVTTVDAFIDDLLGKERVCAVTLWKLPARMQLEDLELLEERVSPLGEEIEALDASDAENGEDGEVSDEEELKELKPDEVETKPESESE